MEIAPLFKDCLSLLNVENIDTISSIVSPLFTFASEMIWLTFSLKMASFRERYMDGIGLAHGTCLPPHSWLGCKTELFWKLTLLVLLSVFSRLSWVCYRRALRMPFTWHAYWADTTLIFMSNWTRNEFVKNNQAYYRGARLDSYWDVTVTLWSDLVLWGCVDGGHLARWTQVHPLGNS